MASFSVTEQAAADIDDILERTLERWGERKYWEYSDLIEQALVVVAQDPTRGSHACCRDSTRDPRTPHQATGA
jgi:plasmid stabilization system protein ParE